MKKLLIVLSLFLGSQINAMSEDEATRLALERSLEDLKLQEVLESSRQEAAYQAELQQAMAESKKGTEKKIKQEKITLNASIQEGADCAYDASKNAVLTLQWLMGKFGDLKKEAFEKQYLQNPRHFPLARLQGAIRVSRKGGMIAFLDNEEVEKIILPILTEGFIPKAKIPDYFTVIPNITEAAENPDYILIMSDWVNAIRKIRNSDNTVHAFIINDARELGKQTGHWIAVVVQKRGGSINYYIIDSMAGYKEKYKDIPKSELKALEDETNNRVNALQAIIEKIKI
jgi:hypothetical protein